MNNWKEILDDFFFKSNFKKDAKLNCQKQSWDNLYLASCFLLSFLKDSKNNNIYDKEYFFDFIKTKLKTLRNCSKNFNLDSKKSFNVKFECIKQGTQILENLSLFFDNNCIIVDNESENIDILFFLISNNEKNITYFLKMYFDKLFIHLKIDKLFYDKINFCKNENITYSAFNTRYKKDLALGIDSKYGKKNINRILNVPIKLHFFLNELEYSKNKCLDINSIMYNKNLSLPELRELRDKILNIKNSKDYKYFEKINDDLIIYRKTEFMNWQKQRIGQDKFRKLLIEKYKGKCLISGVNVLELLTSSHILSWDESNDSERLNVHNGFLLLSSIDKLFDSHIISFDENGFLEVASSFIEKYKNYESILQKIGIPIDFIERNKSIFDEIDFDSVNKIKYFLKIHFEKTKHKKIKHNLK